ncbi:MAG: hypothetical protein IT447_09775 [Phycisphaerales bacterium]|nr:hypothetical protein [Phycisphaerales bacterium]
MDDSNLRCTLNLMGGTGLERIAKSPEKSQIPNQGGAKSGALGAQKPTVADLVADVMRLPLADEEKAEAVRRLLAEGDK